MLARKNPKKIVASCPLKAQKIVRSECPAIKSVRSIRTRLNTMIVEGGAPEQIDKFRTALKDAKKLDAKKKHCSKCYHNKEN